MTIAYKDTPIYYQVSGQGNPVVLLHGFLENSQIWKEFIPLLNKNHQVIIMDLFGHGKTPSHAEEHSMGLYADAVNFVLEHLKIKKMALIGHSMGGYISMAYLEKYPDKVDRLLLMDSSTETDSEKRLKEREQVIKIVKKHQKAFVQMGVGNLFAPQSKEKYEAKINWLIDEAMKITPNDIIAAVRGMKNRKDRTDILKNYTGKKWIIAGEDDGLLPVQNLKNIAKTTNAELFVLPDGHMSYIEQQPAVEKLLLRFLDDY